MSIQLPYLPVRPPKPRETGLTMMMDKGLCIRETENFIEMNAPYTDLVKLGFGTAVVSSNLEKKIRLYQQAGILTYFGGTLFEAFVIRNMFDDYIPLSWHNEGIKDEIADIFQIKFYNLKIFGFLDF